MRILCYVTSVNYVQVKIYKKYNPKTLNTMDGRRKRKKETQDAPKRRRLRRKKPTLGSCEINGSTTCSGDSSELVRFDGCTCQKMCMSCARAWLKNSSTCPFCRSNVSLVNGCIDISYQQQREDHDRNKKLFQFVYRGMFHELEIYYAYVPESLIFANKRAQWKVSSPVLYLVKLLDDDGFGIQTIVESAAYYTFCVGKLCSVRGRNQKILLRILFYYTLLKQSGVAYFFLMTMLRHKIGRNSAALDLNWSDDLKISKAIFKDIPKRLFQPDSSCLDLLKESAGTRHYYLLMQPLRIMCPEINWDEIDDTNIFLASDDSLEEEEEEITFFDTTYTLTSYI